MTPEPLRTTPSTAHLPWGPFHNFRTWICLWTCLFICTTCSTPAHSATQQDIQELRTLSSSILINILTYHNPNGTPYDLDAAEAYQGDLQRLLHKTQQLGMPDLIIQTERLRVAIEDLRHLPQSKADVRYVIPPYSLWLPQVIEQQALLNTVLSDLYARQASVSERQKTLHELSWKIERLLLSYQISAFPSLVTPDGVLDAQTLTALDASIQQHLTELSDVPELAQLKKIALHYQSIRLHLLNPATDWGPSAIARYLLGAAKQLDDLAGSIDSL